MGDTTDSDEESGYLTELQQAFKDVRLVPVSICSSQQSLRTNGTALVTLDINWARLKQVTGKYIAETFPLLPISVKQDLKQGNMTSFNSHWKKFKVLDHGILLRSAGMPQVLPVHNDILADHTDPVTGCVYVRNPLAAKLGLEVARFFPTMYPSGVYLNEDGCKTLHGKTPTPLHYDGDHSEGQGNRVQIVLMDDSTSRRVLKFIPDTPRIREAIGNATGTSHLRKRGFQTLKLKEKPRVKHIIQGQGASIGQGAIMFNAGTMHFERQYRSNGGDPFRIYIGYTKQDVVEYVPRRHLIRMAFLRMNGFAMDPFRKTINRKSPLFVNDKSTQYHTCKQTVVDTKLMELFSKTETQETAWLRVHCSSLDLRLMGLSFLSIDDDDGVNSDSEIQSEDSVDENDDDSETQSEDSVEEDDDDSETQSEDSGEEEDDDSETQSEDSGEEEDDDSDSES